MNKSLTENDVVKIFERMTNKVIYDILRQSSNNIRLGRVLSVSQSTSTCDISLTGTNSVLKGVKYPVSTLIPHEADICMVVSADPKVNSQNYIISFYGNRNQNIPSFLAYKNGAQSFTTGFNLVACAGELYDMTSDYDPSSTNYKFTASVQGIYDFSGAVHIQSVTNAARYIATLYKNGVEILRGNDVSAGNTADAGASVSGKLFLRKGDYVQLYAYVSTNLTSLTALQYNYFCGSLIQEIA